jgi:hippurate hydrolase
MANVDTVDVTVLGIGGHGAAPQSTKDPIVLAARIVGALQTIVSRELRPTDPAVVTVGFIHGGTKNNIIPNEVKLGLTLRSYSDDARVHLVEAVKRICRGEAIAAGLPDDRMPIVTVSPEGMSSTYNDPALTKRVHASLTDWLGAAAVKQIDPDMVSEDFSLFGRTAERIPICLFRLGAVAPEKVAESARTGLPLPSLHSSKFAPVPEPTIKTGITAMTGAVLNLLSKK